MSKTFGKMVANLIFEVMTKKIVVKIINCKRGIYGPFCSTH